MQRAAHFPQEIDCSGRTVQESKRTVRKTMLVSQSNTRCSGETRLCGPSQGHVLVVADGLGGQAEGGLAAETAIEASTHRFLDPLPFCGLDVEHAGRLESELRSAVDRLRWRQVLADAGCSNQAVETLIAEAIDRGSSNDVTALVAAFRTRPARAVHQGVERTTSRNA